MEESGRLFPEWPCARNVSVCTTHVSQRNTSCSMTRMSILLCPEFCIPDYLDAVQSHNSGEYTLLPISQYKSACPNASRPTLWKSLCLTMC